MAVVVAVVLVAEHVALVRDAWVLTTQFAPWEWLVEDVLVLGVPMLVYAVMAELERFHHLHPHLRLLATATIEKVWVDMYHWMTCDFLT